jgi:hypothetical protein
VQWAQVECRKDQPNRIQSWSTPETGIEQPGGGRLVLVRKANFLGVQMQSNVKWNFSVDDLQRRLSKLYLP